MLHEYYRSRVLVYDIDAFQITEPFAGNQVIGRM